MYRRHILQYKNPWKKITDCKTQRNSTWYTMVIVNVDFLKLFDYLLFPCLSWYGKLIHRACKLIVDLNEPQTWCSGITGCFLYWTFNIYNSLKHFQKKAFQSFDFKQSRKNNTTITHKRNDHGRIIGQTVAGCNDYTPFTIQQYEMSKLFWSSSQRKKIWLTKKY